MTTLRSEIMFMWHKQCYKGDFFSPVKKKIAYLCIRVEIEFQIPVIIEPQIEHNYFCTMQSHVIELFIKPKKFLIASLTNLQEITSKENKKGSASLLSLILYRRDKQENRVEN